MSKKEVKARAKIRLAAILVSSKKLINKIETMSNDPRVPLWEKKLDEYKLSCKALDLEIETGNHMRIGGQATEGGTVIDVPASSMNLEGK